LEKITDHKTVETSKATVQGRIRDLDLGANSQKRFSFLGLKMHILVHSPAHHGVSVFASALKYDQVQTSSIRLPSLT